MNYGVVCIVSRDKYLRLADKTVNYVPHSGQKKGCLGGGGGLLADETKFGAIQNDNATGF